MKKCPFCAEEIQDEAIKCKHCQEMLEKKSRKAPWYFNNPTIVIVFLCVGPLALPLVWFNPRFSQKTKWIATVIVLVLSYFLGALFLGSVRSLKDYYGTLFQGSF